MILVNIEEIDKQIEVLRKRLHELAQKESYNFVSDEVTYLSEQLDILIVKRERCKIIKK